MLELILDSIACILFNKSLDNHQFKISKAIPKVLNIKDYLPKIRLIIYLNQNLTHHEYDEDTTSINLTITSAKSNLISK